MIHLALLIPIPGRRTRKLSASAGTQYLSFRNESSPNSDLIILSDSLIRSAFCVAKPAG